MASSDIELSPEERHLISEAIRTGDLDLFTNFYMQLPNSGSMWMPDDAFGHYRHLFGYEFMYDAWSQAGNPDEFDVLTREYQYHIRCDGSRQRIVDLKVGDSVWGIDEHYRLSNTSSAFQGMASSRLFVSRHLLAQYLNAQRTILCSRLVDGQKLEALWLAIGSGCLAAFQSLMLFKR